LRDARAWRRLRTRHRNSSAAAISWASRATTAPTRTSSPRCRGASRPRLAADAVARPGGPADAVDVAEGAGAALHVGLEEVERAAEAGMPRRGLFFEALDEAAKILVGEEAVVGTGDEVAEEGLVAGEEAEIEEGGGGGEVFLGQGDGVGGAEDLVTDGEGDVPQGIEEGLGEGIGGLGAEDAGATTRTTSASLRRATAPRPKLPTAARATPWAGSLAARAAASNRARRKPSRKRALARPRAVPSSPAPSRSRREARCRSRVSRRAASSGVALEALEAVEAGVMSVLRERARLSI